jgi:hypothetical protein
MEQVLQLRIDLARAKGAPEEAVQSAEEGLALAETLSGATGAPYLRAAQSAATVYQSAGNLGRSLVLQRQIVSLADLTLPASDAQRGFVRLNAAMAFALGRQFDEAERLADEAVAVGQTMRPPRTDLFARQAEQIHKMKTAAESGAATTAPNGVTVTREGRPIPCSPQAARRA